MRAFLSALVAAPLLLGTASAQPPVALVDKARVATDGYEREIRARDPAAADAFHSAVQAELKRDPATAAAQYKKCLDSFPDYVPAMRHLGMSLVESGHASEGVAWCRRALAAVDSADTRCSLARALAHAHPKETGESSDVKEAKQLVNSALEEWPEDPWPGVTACEIALATGDLPLLDAGAKRLMATAPGDVATLMFESISQASHGRFDDAQTTLAAARAAGLPKEQYEEMSKRYAAAVPWTTRIQRPALIVLAAWVAGALALVFIGMLLSRATLRSAEAMPPTIEGSAQGARLRAVYRGVLAACCAYYYVSLPLVLVLVVVVGGASVYGLLEVGYIPIKLVMIIVISVGVTVFAAIKSVFIRRRDEDPGRRLDLTAHPAIRRTLDEVAARIGTRPVDAVYLTPGTDVAVMERGGLSKRLTGHTERCLILGVGVLDGFRLGAFKAVLAHEYGHFSNKDTAGGSLALAVRNSVHGMAYALARGGAARWYNPAWLFLHGFHRIFMRISQGASRLQEILADRWAAFGYGSAAFEEGLRHVISKSVRFPDQVDATVNEAIHRGGILTNVYVPQPRQPRDESTLERKVREALDREPTVYDSHPSPKDRFRWVSALGAPGAEPESGADAWSLFSDRDQIELSMTEEIRKIVNARHGIPLKG